MRPFNTPNSEQIAFYEHFFDKLSVRPIGEQERARLRFIVDSLSILKLPQDATILDLGCGRGWLAPFLSQHGVVTGVDYSQRPIQFAKSHFAEQGEFIVAEPSDPYLGLGGLRKFNAVVCSEVIEHVKNQRMFMRDLSQWLVPGGGVIMTTPNGNLWERCCSLEMHRRAFQPLENWLTPKQLKAMIEEERYSVIRHVGIPLHKIRYGRSAFFQHKRIQQIVNRLGLSRTFTKLLLPVTLYQGVLAQSHEKATQ